MPVYPARGKMRDSELIGDNDYSFNFHVTIAGTSDDAWGLAEQVMQAYSGILNPPNVTVYQVAINNPDVVNGVQNRPVNMVGARVATGEPLPAWNVARMQGQVTVGGRIHSWYPRVGLTEDDVTGQTFTATMQGRFDAFISALETHGAFCDKDGELFAQLTFAPLVHMRQLGWHRRSRPGFVRGWVPV